MTLDIHGNEVLFKLAVTRAKGISSRAAIGWSLVDINSQLLHYSGCMTGTDEGQLERDIQQYGKNACNLFISSEPSTISFNIQRLTMAIEQSKIASISIGRSFGKEAKNHEWRDWIKHWKGIVKEFCYDPVFEKLTLGEQMLRQHQRPWIVAAVAEDEEGKPVSLVDIANEFDVLNFISILSRQSRAIFYSPSQEGVIDFLPEENNAFEPLELFNVYDNDNLQALFKHCAQESRCSALILADSSMLAVLLKEGCVDEIIYHAYNNKRPHKTPLMPQIFIKNSALKSWKIDSTSGSGVCQRAILNKSDPNLKIPQHLWSRLN